MTCLSRVASFRTSGVQLANAQGMTHGGCNEATQVKGGPLGMVYGGHSHTSQRGTAEIGSFVLYMPK